ncbi:MAG: hypothetical protein J5589_10135 [Firmicutes bacterium]|nr:hypothetical protein [Bacillota bacterium]
MNISPMTPRYLNETILNLCIIIGAIVAIIGIIFLFWKGFSDRDALICTALGALIFFGFRKVRSIQAEHEEDSPKDE